MRHQAVHKCNLNMERQVEASILYHTERGQIDRKVKTEGPKILSNDIFYFKTPILEKYILPHHSPDPASQH